MKNELAKYNLSKDYDLLYDLALKQSIVCVVNFTATCVDICRTNYIDGVMQVNARGIGYIYAMNKDEFYTQCEMMNLQWLVPSAQTKIANYRGPQGVQQPAIYTRENENDPWELISEVGMKRYCVGKLSAETIGVNPVNHRVTIKNVNQDIHVPIYDIAISILNLNWDQQAELISYLAEEAPYDIRNQLRYIEDSYCLTEDGRKLMNQISQVFKN